MNRRLFCVLPAGIFSAKGEEENKIRIFYWSPNKMTSKFIFIDEKEERFRIVTYFGGALEDDWDGPLPDKVNWYRGDLEKGWVKVTMSYVDYLKDLGYEEYE